MKDQELLLKAAAAAGYPVGRVSEFEPAGYGLFVYGVEGEEEGVLSWWNPLTDDGDALRLAVKLGLPVYPYKTNQGVLVPVLKSWESTLADTRRNIVLEATGEKPSN